MTITCEILDPMSDTDLEMSERMHRRYLLPIMGYALDPQDEEELYLEELIINAAGDVPIMDGTGMFVIDECSLLTY